MDECRCICPPVHEERWCHKNIRVTMHGKKKKKKPGRDGVRLAGGYLNMDLEGNSGW